MCASLSCSTGPILVTSAPIVLTLVCLLLFVGLSITVYISVRKKKKISSANDINLTCNEAYTLNVYTKPIHTKNNPAYELSTKHIRCKSPQA